jgi:hypothetical protein
MKLAELRGTPRREHRYAWHAGNESDLEDSSDQDKGREGDSREIRDDARASASHATTALRSRRHRRWPQPERIDVDFTVHR